MERRQMNNLVLFCIIVSIIIGIMPLITNGSGSFVFNKDGLWLSISVFAISFCVLFGMGVFCISNINEVKEMDKRNDEMEKSNKEFRQKTNIQISKIKHYDAKRTTH